MISIAALVLLSLVRLLPVVDRVGEAKPSPEAQQAVPSAVGPLLQGLSDLQDRIVRIRSLINLRFDTGATGKVVSEYTYGTGVLISEDGLIATAQHLVRLRSQVPRARREVAILFHGARGYLPVDVVAEDARQDFALLRANPRALPFRKCFSLTNTSGLLPGSKSYVLGLRAAAPPEDFEAGVIEGAFLDAQARVADLYKGDMEGRGPWVGISQRIFPGYSGGAILDTSGALAGIVVGAPELRGEWVDFSFGVSVEAIRSLVVQSRKSAESDKDCQ